jgi:hypothetical protein
MPSGAKVVESTKVTCTAKVDDAVVYIRLYPTPEEARNDLAARIKDAQKKKPSPWTYTSIKDIGDVGYDARATDGSGKHGVGFVRGPYLVLIETTGTGLDLAEPDARKIDRLLTALVPSTAGATQTGTAQVKTPSGTEKLNTGEKIEINIPSGDRADIEAECENLSYAVMLIEMSNSSIERAQMMGGIFYIWCMKVKYPSPGMSSMIGSGSLCAPWPLQASAGDVQAYLDLELVEGEVLFNVVQEGVTLDVKTGTLVASSTGKSTFDVVYDPAGQQTTVAVRQGSVEIRPANEAVQPFTLSSGEKVDVSADEVGQVTAFEPGFAASATAEPGVKATKTAPEPQPSKGPLGLSNEAWMGIGGACVCGLCGVLVLGLLIVVVWRRRSRPAPLPSPRLVGVAPAAGVDHPSTARLVLAAGRASRPSVDIPLAGLTIGRERANLLSIHDSLASRQHARIDYAAGAWVITDLSSSNGTYVNGMRITRQALQPGDQIQIGGVVLVFQAGKQ